MDQSAQIVDPFAEIEFSGGRLPTLGSPVVERDKKTLFWMTGVLDCFSTVWALFKTGEYEESQDNNWEVPISLITDLVYLGSGAQGVVFGGSFKGEMVAVKKLRDKTEANIKHLRKLNHENIVRFRGVCTVSQFHCLIMEYCQYGPLFDFLHSGVTFNPKQIIKWATDIALGMSYLHTHKIIHRDLKSPNILIADNLVVKVSDFGTSREWNDVSAIMSFTGTVAWMAPEVIRHEPCSERVDVWSYGVVLWELLTQEIPYKNLETHAIMWGVGTDTIALPVPSTCPSSIQLLLNQCWNRVSRSRPPFKIIAGHLEMVGEDFCSMDQESFKKTQDVWRKEVHSSMDRLYSKAKKPVEDAFMQRREDIKQVRDVRFVYEQQLSRANELYMEVCSVRLQLEQREQVIAEKEIALGGCRCGMRKNFKYFHRQTSSSSDGVIATMASIAENNRRRRKKHGGNSPAQLVVKYDPDNLNEGNTVTTSVDECICMCNKKNINNNITTNIAKETIVEDNGNIIIQDTGCNIEIPLNNNYVPVLTHV